MVRLPSAPSVPAPTVPLIATAPLPLTSSKARVWLASELTVEEKSIVPLPEVRVRVPPAITTAPLRSIDAASAPPPVPATVVISPFKVIVAPVIAMSLISVSIL